MADALVLWKNSSIIIDALSKILLKLEASCCCMLEYGTVGRITKIYLLKIVDMEEEKNPRIIEFHIQFIPQIFNQQVCNLTDAVANIDFKF